MASATTLTAASIHPSSSFSAASSAAIHQGPHQPSSASSLPQQQSTQPPPPPPPPQQQQQQQHQQQQLPPSSATMAAPMSSLQPSSQSHSQPSSQQSFGTSQPSGLPSAPWRQYNDPKGPQIYLAIYSGVEVYEMEVNNVALMRRRKDSWLNATQILKVAGVDKGKRTKILEKEIQTGEHEKVQGGYGKYQGTWIKFERGVEVCRQYGVEELVRPLLTYDMGQDGSQAGHGDFNTPTKEQAMAAQRKRMYTQATELRAAGQPGTTFFRNISSTASHALSAINKARFDSPGPRGRGSLSKAPSFSRQPSMQGEDLPPNSQQSYVSDYGNDFTASQQTQDGLEPPRKRQRVVTPADSFGGYNQSSADMYASQFPGSPTEPNESFVYVQAGINIHPEHDGTTPLPPLPMDMSPDAQQKRSVLMGLFMDPNTTDPAKYADVFRSLTPVDLDMPIDNFCHTALHWAATLSRTALLRALISTGASPYRVNASGETPLIRAATVTNSMEYSTFPELLDALGGTIDIRDSKGRTVLHHIAVSSAVKGRNAASKYYLESLLEWVVRQGSGSVPNSQSTAINGGAASGGAPKMNIGRFMSEIVNAQDNSGDTALNIAARIGNRSIIYQLLEVGADPNIANRAGLRPSDFGIGTDVGDGVNGGTNADKSATGNQKSKESSNDIVTSITHLLSETSSGFQDELKSKQQSVDSITAQIRTASAQVADARRKLEQMQAKLRAQQLARQRVLNFSRANPEEQFRLKDLERKHPKADPNIVLNWDKELAAGIEREHDTIPSSQGEASPPGNSLPPVAELRARIKALKAKIDMTQRQTGTLQVRSRDAELKYRKVVSLCTGVAEGEIESVVEGLLRAVESEKGELELGRVRRFLGGVETVC